MKQKKSVSAVKRGLNRSSHPSQLSNLEVSMAVNVNTNSEIGDSLNYQLEPSNRLGVRQNEGYKVIGFKNDLLKERTYYFLTNTEETLTTGIHYKRSSIGYVDYSKVLNNDFNNTYQLENCSECEQQNNLNTPLELQVQTPSQNYVELVHDRCIVVVDLEDKGLNFNINSPIKKIEIKQEKLGTNLYWNDWRNYFRYLQVGRIEEAIEKGMFDYLHTLDIACQDPIATSCLDVDKLLVAPLYTRLEIEADKVEIGGNLKMGTYEFYPAYCDINANSISDYSTPTNPISIWDENNYIQNQTETDGFTNYAIKLKIKNLEIKRFKYYKVVVVERNNVNNTQSVFLVGVFPTTDDTVSYTHSSSSNDDLYLTRGNVSIKKRLDFSELLAKKPRYKRMKGTMVTDSRLIGYGLEEEAPINIQPVVNLLSALHWQTSAAKEDLYNNPISTSLYKHYMPDEVQPFSLRLLYKDGGYSPNFSLIGRPSTPTDLEIITDKNYQSLFANAPKCTTGIRNKRWQIFNTAKEYEEQCSSFEEGVFLTQSENIVKTCEIIGVATIIAPNPLNPVIIEIDPNYIDLKTYINENYDEVTNPSSNLYIPQIASALLSTYPLNHCTPSFGNSCDLPPNLDSFKNNIGEIDYKIPVGTPLVVGNDYIINTLSTGDDFTNVGFIKIKEYFTALSINPIAWTTTEVLIRDKKLIESVFPTEYESTEIKNNCTLYKSGSNLGRDYDERAFKPEEIQKLLVGQSYISILPCNQFINKREFNFSNTELKYADDIQNINQIGTSAYQGYFNNYTISDNINSLFQTKNAVSIGVGWNNSLHLNALWFKNTNTKDRFVFEVTPQKSQQGNTDFLAIGYDKTVRVSFYKDKNATSPFFTVSSDLVTGSKFLFKKTITGYDIKDELGNVVSVITNYRFYIAIDNRIIASTISQYSKPFVLGNFICSDIPGISYRTAPTDGCYSIVTRDIEYSRAELNWQNIKINKTETYSSTCQFKIPKVDSCSVKPYKKGSFAYWESTEKYSDNKELFDSSVIKVKPIDLSLLNTRDKEDFILRHTTSTITTELLDLEGNYIYKKNPTNALKAITDLRCEPIRHTKMPDNTVAPFMIDMPNYQKNADSIIFPLGVNIDSKAIETILDISLKNKLITKKQRDNIQGYEILRGDNSISKSVIANGIASDMYNYQEGDKKVHYSNYPFNDLGNNKFAFEKGTNNLIKHPYKGIKNHLFAFMSPDIYLTKPILPTEVSLQGFQFGNCDTGFASVDKHPKWTVLGTKSKRTAEQLATAEFALEVAIQSSNIVKEIVVGFSTNIGSAIASVAYAISVGIASYVKIGKYRYDWLKIFRDLGRADNFAEFQYSYGKHNRFLKVSQNSPDYLRALTIKKYLGSSRYNITDENDGSNIKINNWLREQSVLLSTGNNFALNYPTDYINFDNNTVNSNSSGFIKSEIGCDFEGTSTRDIASPYFSLKNYIPDQWGTLDSIKWLTTNYIFNLNDNTNCKPIYGGTVCISRFSVRKKIPLFEKNDVKGVDKSPFKYSRYSNIGTTRFFCDYETEDDAIYQGTGIPFPDIGTSLGGFDCVRGNRGFYVEPPSKFYLFVHGVSDFLVQSEINCNFRYSGKEPKDRFYQKQDLVEWLQETNLPIVEPNTFYYNNTYSLPVSNTPFNYLDRTYNKEEMLKRVLMPNFWIWSEKDNSENDGVDSWLIYKPLNTKEEETNNGKLIDLTSIESNQFLARYENELALYNQPNPYADAINSQNKELGTGLLYTKPITFKATNLGFAGTQNSEIVSTPFGHFWCDAKRGKIFKVDQNGQGLEIISENIEGKPSGMTPWFREHLPFKILKYLPNVDIDNKFKGIGVNMWWDDRENRLFVTKRDWIPKNPNLYTVNKNGVLFNGLNEVFFNETEFINVSWTIAYKPTEGTWNSYFSFYPDYSPFHNNFFQTGYNWGVDKGTVWNHLLNRSSFCVFQGKKHTPILEFAVASENVNKILNSVALNLEAHYYLNDWESTTDKDKSFKNMFIYNGTNNTGMLELIPQKSLNDIRKYPITEGNIQKVLYTAVEDKQQINYFFNRLKNEQNNIAMFVTDKNSIFKTINNSAVNFSPRKVLERMKGEYFLIHLEGMQDSRFNLILKNSIANETIYE